MRTLLLLFAFSMLPVNDVFAQQAVNRFDKQPIVTLSENDAPLRKILFKIFLQTGYGHADGDNLLKQARPVNINVKNAPLWYVLELCFSNQPLIYRINARIISILPKPVLHPVLKDLLADKKIVPIEKATVEDLSDVIVIGYGK
jgi:hypothetical protein